MIMFELLILYHRFLKTHILVLILSESTPNLESIPEFELSSIVNDEPTSSPILESTCNPTLIPPLYSIL